MWFIDLQMELQNYTKRFINNQFRQKTVTLDCQQLKIDHISIGRNDINYVAMAILSILKMPCFIISMALFAINKYVILVPVFFIDLSISMYINVMMNDRLRFYVRLNKTL